MMRAFLVLLALVSCADADADAPAPLQRPRRCPLPAMPAPGPADVVVTTSMGSWSAVRPLVTAATRQILITPGDYEAWGHLDIGPTWPSGTPSAPIVIRYYDPDTEEAHPVERRAPATEARIHGIMWWGDVHDFVAHGLTIRTPDPTVTNGILHVLNADRVLLDGNLMENLAQPYGLRVRDSFGGCVQHNVIRNSTNPAVDSVGIDIKPNASNIVGLRVVANDVSDWTDSIQLTNQGTFTVQAQILDNDLYTTTAKHVMDPATGLMYGCTENAIDVKTFTSSPLYIAGNRMWGFRETPPFELLSLCGPGFASGSAGDAIVVHMDATNVIIERNEISDSVSALRAKQRVGGRQLVFRSNKVTNVPPMGASTRFYRGAALVLEDDTLVNANVFDGVPLLCPRHGDQYPVWPPAGYNPAPPRVVRNVSRIMMEGGACSVASIVEESP